MPETPINSETSRSLHKERVQRFVEAHWSNAYHARPGLYTLALENWLRALVDEGWAVPPLPVSFGGLGWDAEQVYCLQSLCQAEGCPGFLTIATEKVAPLLLHAGTADQRQRHLPGIAAAPTSWMYAIYDSLGPEHAPQKPARLDQGQGRHAHGYLTGVKMAEVDHPAFLAGHPMAPRMLLCFALDENDQQVICLVNLANLGVQVERPSGLSRSVRITLSGALVEANNILPLRGESLARSLQQSSETLPVAEGSGFDYRCQRLRRFLADQHVDEGDTLVSDLDALSVEVAALSGMEQRLLNPDLPNVIWSGLRALCQIKVEQVALELGALQQACFGYYALLDGGFVALDNEGGIGPQDEWAFDRTQTARLAMAPLSTGHAGFALKNVLVSDSLTLPPLLAVKDQDS